MGTMRKTPLCFDSCRRADSYTAVVITLLLTIQYEMMNLALLTIPVVMCEGHPRYLLGS